MSVDTDAVRLEAPAQPRASPHETSSKSSSSSLSAASAPFAGAGVGIEIAAGVSGSSTLTFLLSTSTCSKSSSDAPLDRLPPPFEGAGLAKSESVASSSTSRLGGAGDSEAIFGVMVGD